MAVERPVLLWQEKKRKEKGTNERAVAEASFRLFLLVFDALPDLLSCILASRLEAGKAESA